MNTPQAQRLRVAHLNPNAPTPFHLKPDAETRAAIAAELDLLALPKLSFQGQITAEGRDGWRLTAQLSARVKQACVVTLAPVSTDIAAPSLRRYSPHTSIPEGEEVEMQDETLEPLGAFIDLSAAMIEDLALALPEYPRAPDARLTQDDESAPDENNPTRKPFAGLDKLLGTRET